MALPLLPIAAPADPEAPSRPDAADADAFRSALAAAEVARGAESEGEPEGLIEGAPAAGPDLPVDPAPAAAPFAAALPALPPAAGTRVPVTASETDGDGLAPDTSGDGLPPAAARLSPPHGETEPATVPRPSLPPTVSAGPAGEGGLGEAAASLPPEDTVAGAAPRSAPAPPRLSEVPVPRTETGAPAPSDGRPLAPASDSDMPSATPSASAEPTAPGPPRAPAPASAGTSPNGPPPATGDRLEPTQPVVVPTRDLDPEPDLTPRGALRPLPTVDSVSVDPSDGEPPRPLATTEETPPAARPLSTAPREHGPATPPPERPLEGDAPPPAAAAPRPEADGPRPPAPEPSQADAPPPAEAGAETSATTEPPPATAPATVRPTARTAEVAPALPPRLATPVWLDRLDVLAAAPNHVEVALGEGDGTVRLQTRRDGDQLSVVVRFSDPELGALAGAHARQIAEALEQHFAEPVRLALGDATADGRGRGDQRGDARPEAPSAGSPTASGPPPPDASPRPLGPREWVG